MQLGGKSKGNQYSLIFLGIKDQLTGIQEKLLKNKS